jgi:hypothetical protein
MRISTIIPAYNRAALIGETLDSILSQTRAPDELIVVDDGSTDGTADAVAAFGKAVTLLRQANAGAGPARNAGFAASSGEIVHFMDSDDLSSPNTYALAAAAIERGADMTYGPWLKTRIAGDTLDPEPFVLQQGPIRSSRPLDVLALLVEWVTLFQACLFRRELIERAGPFRGDLKPSEDTEMLYRVTRAAAAPVHVGGMLLLYRVHPNEQVSARDLGGRLIDRARLWGVLESHLAERGGVSAEDRREFRRKKLDVACDVRPFDPAGAKALSAGVPPLDRATRRLRQLARRGIARWRVETTGNPYPPVFAAAALTAEQRALISAMGYRLDER